MSNPFVSGVKRAVGTVADVAKGTVSNIKSTAKTVKSGLQSVGSKIGNAFGNLPNKVAESTKVAQNSPLWGKIKKGVASVLNPARKEFQEPAKIAPDFGIDFDAKAKKAIEEERAWQAQQAEINREWQKMMSDTAFQRQAKDLEAAGMSRYLAAGGGGASTPSGATATAGAQELYTQNDQLKAALQLLAVLGRNFGQIGAWVSTMFDGDW